jgi:hypothetical protein
MYGGNSAELFVMPSGGDVADATPVDGGKRYGSQPYAFKYREKFEAGCVGQLQTAVASLAQAARIPANVAAVARPVAPTSLAKQLIPTPQARPVRFEDPETMANARGDLEPRPISIADVATGLNGVRMVGAGYFNLILEQFGEVTDETPPQATVSLTP